MTKNTLKEAMRAVDAGESSFVGDGPMVFVDAAKDAVQLAAPVDKVAATLAERKTTHGAYEDHARCTQSLKRVIALELDARDFRGQPPLTDRQRESIDMILHKIGRAVAGDSGFADHWIDIQGYARIAIDN